MKKSIIVLMVLGLLFSGMTTTYAKWFNCATNDVSIWDVDTDTIKSEGDFISVDARLTLTGENRPGFAKYAFARYYVEKSTLQFATSAEESYDVNRNFVGKANAMKPQYPKRGTIMYDFIYCIAH